MGEENKTRKTPSVRMSFTVLGIALIMLLFGVVIFKFDMHVVLLVTTGVVCIATKLLGYSFDEMVGFMTKPIADSMSALVLFLFIGIIIASWIFSGTVPALIYYGLQYITPSLFLPFGLFLCCLTSLSIGTSWGTVGTLGVAMMGIGEGMGIPAPITAGMVISGSFFGDKMSPMSDTTNLAPATAGTDVQKHVKAMWFTAMPAFVIAIIAFTIIGLFYNSSSINYDNINMFLETLDQNFVINPIVLIPIIVLFVLNMCNFPAIPGMAIGSLLGIIIAVLVQKIRIVDVLTGLNYGYNISTGVEMVDSLIMRGGIQSMMYTFSIAFISISLGGVLEQAGYLNRILEVIISRVKSDRLLAPIVISCTTLGTLAMGEVYFALIVTGNLFRNEFIKRKLRPEMLSRLLEEGGTMMQVFIPWSTSGIFIAGTLGVAVSEYWPYTILCYMNPIISIVLSLLGYGILREGAEKVRSIKKGKTNAKEI